MTNYKYKVKVIPGTLKKGKAVRQAAELMLKSPDVTQRERDLIRCGGAHARLPARPRPQPWRRSVQAGGLASRWRLQQCLRPGPSTRFAPAPCRAVPEMDALQTLCGTVKIQVGKHCSKSQGRRRTGGRGTSRGMSRLAGRDGWPPVEVLVVVACLAAVTRKSVIARKR